MRRIYDSLYEHDSSPFPSSSQQCSICLLSHRWKVGFKFIIESFFYVHGICIFIFNILVCVGRLFGWITSRSNYSCFTCSKSISHVQWRLEPEFISSSTPLIGEVHHFPVTIPHFVRLILLPSIAFGSKWVWEPVLIVSKKLVLLLEEQWEWYELH